jgi:DNA-binding NarL/FixJ family response regulator
MRVYWERIGLLGPIYRLVGKGFNDREIADKLHITEITVQDCISWMLYSFKMHGRMELAQDAFSTERSPYSAHLKGR